MGIPWSEKSSSELSAIVRKAHGIVVATTPEQANLVRRADRARALLIQKSLADPNAAVSGMAKAIGLSKGLHDSRLRSSPEGNADDEDISEETSGGRNSPSRGASLWVTDLSDEDLDAVISGDPGTLLHNPSSSDYEAANKAREGMTELVRRSINPRTGKQLDLKRGSVV